MHLDRKGGAQDPAPITSTMCKLYSKLHPLLPHVSTTLANYNYSESIAARYAAVDVGGMFIHGVVGNPIAGLVKTVGGNTRPYVSTILFGNDGKVLEPLLDKGVESDWNEVLEKAHKNGRSEPASEQTVGKLIEGHEDRATAFGDTLARVKADNNKVYDPHREAIFSWHKANLEMSCGINLEKVGREWNEDEAYGFEGDHVLIKEGYGSLMSALADGVDIRFDTKVTNIATWGTSPSADDSAYAYGVLDKGASKVTKTRSGGVTVTTDKGSIDADVCICTVPLGVLKNKAVKFSPELPARKQLAIDRLGMGVLNKCALSFEAPFWDSTDFIGHCGTEHGEYILVTNIGQMESKPVLCFMFGGDFASDVEKLPDAKIVEDCMNVLRKMYPDCPKPIDHYVSRWQTDQYATGSFCYIPPGVSGEEHRHLEEPLCDKNGDLRLMFAGEATSR